MSAPVIWIVFPMVVSGGLLFLLNYPRLLKTIGIGVSFLLALTAILQPIGNVLQLGNIVLDFRPDLVFLGRSLFLDNGDRFVLSLIYSSLFLYILLMDERTIPSKFIPLSMAISAMLVAALGVQPFLYAAVLVELAVLIMILMVRDKNIDQEKGIIRFLVYLTLAMPFILFSGWILGGTQASPSEQIRLTGAAVTLIIGFSLWLAVFPFHSWVPQFSRAVQPYLFGFIFSQLPVVIIFIIVNYISSLVWLRSASYLAPVLSSVGIIMIVTTGFWASVEKDLKRLLAYSVLLETGFSLVMISFKSDQGLTLLYQSSVPRILALALLVYSLSIFASSGVDLTLIGMRGVIRRYPFATAGILLALFTISGFPLFSSFPLRIELLRQLGLTSVSSVVWTIVGLTGFIIAVIKFFIDVTLPLDDKWHVNEKISQIIVICLIILILVLFGLFPLLLQNIISPFTMELPVLR